MNSKYYILVYFLTFSGILLATAQEEKLLHVHASSQNNQKVIVNYSLHSHPKNKFNVEIFSSLDDYQTPLTSVTGAVGKNIDSGEDKEIHWNPWAELDDFEGKIDFIVKATYSYRQLELQKSMIEDKYKRGESIPIQWKGGLKDEKLQVELFYMGTLIEKQVDISNSSTYSYTIAKSIKKGKGYQLRISSSNDQSNFDVSNYFDIK